MEYDWIRSSQDARRLLYRTSKVIVDRHFLGNWSRFYEAVFDRKSVPGTGYEDNFRSGRISRVKANAIARWIGVHHAQDGLTLIAAQGGQHATPSALDWSSFIEKHGISGDLAIVKINVADLSVVGFAHARRDDVARIKLGDGFCFQLKAIKDGAAIALQETKSTWYPLPLTRDAMAISITAGSQILPRDLGNDAPLPLSEDSDTGLHRFIMIVAATDIIAAIAQFLSAGIAIAPDQLRDVIDAVTRDSAFTVYRVEAMII